MAGGAPCRSQVCPVAGGTACNAHPLEGRPPPYAASPRHTQRPLARVIIMVTHHVGEHEGRCAAHGELCARGHAFPELRPGRGRPLRRAARRHRPRIHALHLRAQDLRARLRLNEATLRSNIGRSACLLRGRAKRRRRPAMPRRPA
eukprot:349785-Chlamydomonas_euryale.AAC.9